MEGWMYCMYVHVLVLLISPGPLCDGLCLARAVAVWRQGRELLWSRDSSEISEARFRFVASIAVLRAHDGHAVNAQRSAVRTQTAEGCMYCSCMFYLRIRSVLPRARGANAGSVWQQGWVRAGNDAVF